jgi:uncharacterized protein (TIGR03000 family)
LARGQNKGKLSLGTVLKTEEAKLMDGSTYIMLVCALVNMPIMQQETDTPPTALPPSVMASPPASVAPRRRPMAFTIPGFQRGYPQGSLDPWWYGYNFGDNAAGYYGGGNYTRYYAYTRGFPSIGDFPGPVPGPVWTNDPKRTPYLHQMPMFTQRNGNLDGPVMTNTKPKNNKVSATEVIENSKLSQNKHDNETNVAKISIVIPETAKLIIEDATTKQIGKFREFISPQLEPGVDYVYHLKAEWIGSDGKNSTREIKVALRASQHHRVIFNNNSEQVSVELLTSTH